MLYQLSYSEIITDRIKQDRPPLSVGLLSSVLFFAVIYQYLQNTGLEPVTARLLDECSNPTELILLNAHGGARTRDLGVAWCEREINLVNIECCNTL